MCVCLWKIPIDLIFHKAKEKLSLFDEKKYSIALMYRL
jgi:hypothetical protein